MSIRVTGRVITVKVNDDSTSFTVHLGPSPDIFWFRSTAHRPPKLGQKLLVVGSVLTKGPLVPGSNHGTVTHLEVERFEIIAEPYPTRAVPEQWLKRVKASMRRPLYRYQVEGSGWMSSRIFAGAGAILADDQGIGKSTQAVAALCATDAFPAVVICPASLKVHWAREFWFSVKRPKVTIIEGYTSRIEKADVYICNYDILRHREQALLAIRPRLYLIDEAQELKHPDPPPTHRAMVATRLVSQTIGALVLTGTPIMNRPNEFWRLLHLADPKAWPSFKAYRSRYLSGRKGKEVGRSMRTSAGKVERLNELQAAYAPCLLRRMKSQVLTDLPPKSRRSVLVSLDDKSMAHYKKAELDVVAWLRSLGQAERASEAAKAPSLVKLTMLRRIAALGKLQVAIPEYLKRWFSDHGAEPLVIFGYHKDVMEGLWKICQRLRIRTTGVGGGESTAKRQRAIDDFQSGRADVFLAPIRTAGVGLNLQRAAESLFVERIWTPSGLLQAEDRIHRLGQTRPVTVTYIDAQGTVDEHIASVLEAKQRIINAVVDDGDPVAESMATVSAVISRMLAS